MTPVDMTRLLGPSVDVSLGWNKEDAVDAISRASSRPPVPVTAFAQPELITMLRRPDPPRFSMTERDTCTGAAWNLLVVKTAAPLQGRSEAIKATSGLEVFEALTPTWIPETEKPLGYVPDVGTYFTLEDGIAESMGAEYSRTKLRVKLRIAVAEVFAMFATFLSNICCNPSLRGIRTTIQP
jgi:hypothetical protein